jgi:hypothetical protein
VKTGPTGWNLRARRCVAGSFGSNADTHEAILASIDRSGEPPGSDVETSAGDPEGRPANVEGVRAGAEGIGPNPECLGNDLETLGRDLETLGDDLETLGPDAAGLLARAEAPGCRGEALRSNH